MKDLRTGEVMISVAVDAEAAIRIADNLLGQTGVRGATIGAVAVKGPSRPHFVPAESASSSLVTVINDPETDRRVGIATRSNLRNLAVVRYGTTARGTEASVWIRDFFHPKADHEKLAAIEPYVHRGASFYESGYIVDSMPELCTVLEKELDDGRYIGSSALSFLREYYDALQPPITPSE